VIMNFWENEKILAKTGRFGASREFRSFQAPGTRVWALLRVISGCFLFVFKFLMNVKILRRENKKGGL